MLLSPAKLWSSAKSALSDCSAPDRDTWTRSQAALVWELHRHHPEPLCAAKSAARAILIHCVRLHHNRVLVPVESGRHRSTGKHHRR